MLGAAYGPLRLGVAAWWSGPVIITGALLITLRWGKPGRHDSRIDDALAGGMTFEGR